MSRIWALPYSTVIPALMIHLPGIKAGLRGVIPGDVLCGFEGHKGAVAFYEYIENNAPYNPTLYAAFLNHCKSGGMSFLVQSPASQTGSARTSFVHVSPVSVVSAICYPASSAMGKQKLSAPFAELQLSEPLKQRIYRELEEGSPVRPGACWIELVRSLSDVGGAATDLIISQIQKRGQYGTRTMAIIQQFTTAPDSKHTVERVANAFKAVGMLEVANELRAKVGVEPFREETVPGVQADAVLEQEKCPGCKRYEMLNLILGCGHQICDNCSELHTCPVCGQPITSKIRM